MTTLYGLGVYGAGLYGYGEPNTSAVLDSGAIVLGETDTDGVHWSLQRGSDPFGNPPAPRDVSGERATAHGTWNATEFYGPRSWPISLVAIAPDHDQLHRARHRLAAAVSLASSPVWVNEPYFGVRWAMFRRVGELMWTEETPTIARATFTLLADDPRIVGQIRTTSTGFPTSAGGLAWPATWPAVWDATVTSGTLQIDNDGLHTADVLWRIDGPVVDPFIVDPTTGQQLRTSLTLAAGEWLTIDTATHRVLGNGDPNASRRDRIYGDWIDAPVGSRQVQFGAAVGGPGAQLTATWRDTWI